MKLKDLKNWLDSLPAEELEKELLYNSLDYGISGTIAEINRTDENLYYIGDDPVIMHTRKELLQRGYTDKEIAGFDIEIPKNCYYVELSNEYSILERFTG